MIPMLLGALIVALLFASYFRSLWAGIGAFVVTFAVAVFSREPETTAHTEVPTMIRNSKMEG